MVSEIYRQGSRHALPAAATAAGDAQSRRPGCLHSAVACRFPYGPCPWQPRLIRRSGGKSESVGLLCEPHSDGLYAWRRARRRGHLSDRRGRQESLSYRKHPGILVTWARRLSATASARNSGTLSPACPMRSGPSTTSTARRSTITGISFMRSSRTGSSSSTIPAMRRSWPRATPSRWRGTAPTPGWGRALMRPLPPHSSCRQRAGGRRRSARWPPRSRLVTSAGAWPR